MKVTFMGAGSTVFAKNVLGDIMLTSALRECDIALYDIDPERLEESYLMVTALNRNINENRASVSKYLGVEERKDALRGADFVINAIQVGLYDPCTIIDFEVPKKYGLRQTIADSNGIGGIFRALRTIPVLKDFTDDMKEVCPNAYFLNYTNPMAQLAGWLGRYSGVKSVGLCHSVQTCSRGLLDKLGILCLYKEVVIFGVVLARLGAVIAEALYVFESHEVVMVCNAAFEHFCSSFSYLGIEIRAIRILYFKQPAHMIYSCDALADRLAVFDIELIEKSS